jgi:hypothetical protein
VSAATQAPDPSFWMRPGGELTDLLDALDVDREVRDVLCFVAGRDPETFARAVAYAAPHALPARVRALLKPRGAGS